MLFNQVDPLSDVSGFHLSASRRLSSGALPDHAAQWGWVPGWQAALLFTGASDWNPAGWGIRARSRGGKHCSVT